MMTKNGDFWVVCRNISVELLLIEIPLDTVEAVPFEVVVTFEDGLMAFEGVRRDQGVRQELHTYTT